MANKMSARNKLKFDPRDAQHMHTLRWCVAGIVKDLAALRALTDKKWCRREAIDRIWFRTSKRPTCWSGLYILNNVMTNIVRFRRCYAYPLRGIPLTGRVGRLRSVRLARELSELVRQLTNMIKLKKLERYLRHNKQIDWDEYVKWELLPTLRRLLDALPENT